jgi:DNA-binding PadR family transcriptional regulator
VADLNPTQGSLLGFLADGPMTGWDLLQRVEGGLGRFWNITPSHVYRELQALEARKLVKAGPPGVRDRRPFTITAAGRRAFQAWVTKDPGREQIRFPLLVTLWFGRHLDPATRARFLDVSRADHEQRLALYEGIVAPDPHTGAVLAFGVAYERAVLGWLDDLRRPPAPTTGSEAAATEGASGAS